MILSEIVNITNPSEYDNPQEIFSSPSGRAVYIHNLSIVPINGSAAVSLLIKDIQLKRNAFLFQNIVLSNDDPLYMKKLFLAPSNSLMLQIDSNNITCEAIDILIQYSLL